MFVKRLQLVADDERQIFKKRKLSSPKGNLLVLSDQKYVNNNFEIASSYRIVKIVSTPIFFFANDCLPREHKRHKESQVLLVIPCGTCVLVVKLNFYISIVNHT